MLDWRRSDIERPSLYARVWSAQVGVREASCKPGAKLAVHHVNRKLTLDQTRRARDCWKSALSCTYIPTNVYSGCYAHGLPACERNFVLEGVTQLEEAMLWRVSTSSSPQPCKINFWERISTKAWSRWSCHRVFRAWVLAVTWTKA